MAVVSVNSGNTALRSTKLCQNTPKFLAKNDGLLSTFSSKFLNFVQSEIIT